MESTPGIPDGRYSNCLNVRIIISFILEVDSYEMCFNTMEYI